MLLVVAALEVDLEEAVEGHDLAGGAQADLAVGAGDVDGGALEAGGLHLAGDRALPDQVVELALVGLEPASCSGAAAMSVGRMHSCASWAFLALFLYMRGRGGT